MSQYRSHALNLYSPDETTVFRVDPENSFTNIHNTGRRIDINTDVRIWDSTNTLVNPITFAENLIKDSSGITVNFDNVQTLLSDALDASGNVVADHTQIQANQTAIATHTTDIADLLARVIVLEGQIQQLTAN